MKKPNKTKEQAYSFLNALYPDIPHVTLPQLQKYYAYRKARTRLWGLISNSLDEATLKKYLEKNKGDKK